MVSDDTQLEVFLIVDGPDRTHRISTGRFTVEGDGGDDFSYTCFLLEAIDIHLLPNREILCDENPRG